MSLAETIEDRARDFLRDYQAVRTQVQRVIVGHEEVVEGVLTCLCVGGHCLLEGVPGLGKTLLVRTLSQALRLQFSRIQFTPDLMPSDITGTNVLDENDTGRREFRFVEGPVFTNILLADEINRTPPKTQAALLQSMQEREVTVGQTTYKLPEPFFVIATQNPIEQEGTYPLPEAQLDRFMFNVKVDYPNLAEEERILTASTSGERQEVRKVLSAKAILYLQKQISTIEAGPLTINYVARLVRATRPGDPTSPKFVRDMVDWGAGPRAGQFLIAGGKAMAAMDGRPSVSMQDIRRVAIPVLRHRISTNFQAQAEGMDPETVITRLLDEVPEPKIPKYV